MSSLFWYWAGERVNNNSFFPSQVCGHDFIKLTIVHFPSGEKWLLLPIRAGDRQTQKLEGKQRDASVGESYLSILWMVFLEVSHDQAKIRNKVCLMTSFPLRFIRMLEIEREKEDGKKVTIGQSDDDNWVEKRNKKETGAHISPFGHFRTSKINRIASWSSRKNLLVCISCKKSV